MKNEDQASTDRRKHHRYPIFASALIKTTDGETDIQVEGMVVDISQTGVGFYTYVPIAKGANMSVEIKFTAASGIEQKDNLEGRVACMSKIGSLYYSGLAFNEELNPDRQPVLYEHFWKTVRWR